MQPCVRWVWVHSLSIQIITLCLAALKYAFETKSLLRSTWQRLHYFIWQTKSVWIVLSAIHIHLINIFYIIWKIPNAVRPSVSKGSVKYQAWRFVTAKKCTLEIHFGNFFLPKFITQNVLFYCYLEVLLLKNTNTCGFHQHQGSLKKLNISCFVNYLYQSNFFSQQKMKLVLFC